MTIKILTTGGTIDGLEYDSEDKAPKMSESFIPKLFKRSRVTVKTEIEHVLAKDSKFIIDTDREIIYQKCLASKEEAIIITHGTMTMADTAKYLGLKNIPKTIVLVGAAIPANHENSDALFNFGSAFSAVQLLPHGVYISMNGQIFKWDNVTKNLAKGIFENES
jgi:L-asparaginase